MDNQQTAPLSSDEVSETTTTGPLSRGGASVEMGRPKTGTMGVSGKVNLRPDQTSELLRNMQAELDRRSSPMNTFLSGLQRASAWGSGGENGPAAALTAMDREQLLKDQDTRSMQQNMLALKAQQAARQKFLENQGYGQPSAAAQPGAVAAQPGAARPGLQLPNYMSVIANLPESMQASAMTAIENGDEATWNAIIQAAEKNRTPDSRNLEQLRRMENDPYADLFKGQTFEKGLAPRTYVDPVSGHDRRFSPQMGMPPAARAPSSAPAPSGVDLKQVALDAGIPASAIISDYRDPAKQLSLIDREDPNKPGSYLTKEGKPVALPGRSAHQIPGAAIDLKPGYELTPVQKQALKQAGAVQVPGSPNHYELPMPKINAELAVSRNVATPAAGTSVQEVALQQKALEASIQSFMANDYKAITERANEAKNIEKLSDQVLANIEGNNFGPGTKLAQSFAEYAQIAGIKLNPKETQKFVDNMGIETARKFLSAAGARQAMGAQFTAVEAADWLKAFAGIDNKKEYIKNFYQVQRAGALVDQDVKNYLLRNKGREQEAYVEWQNSGRKDKIMQENVDSFKNGKLGKVEIPGAKPATQKTVKRTGMVTDKNNPNYQKQVIQYTDGTVEYK